MSPGMRQNTWLADIFEVQLGLAARIGEVLALTIGDLDLDNAESPRVTIAATVITPMGSKHSRQEHTKDGPGGRRTVIIHEFAAKVLRKRAALAADRESKLLFVTRNETLLDPHNVRESWRNIRAASDLEWMRPHHLRKTALSSIANVFGVESARAFADHANVETTDISYIDKGEKEILDLRNAFDELAPHPTTGDNESSSFVG
jgi:integrase